MPASGQGPGSRTAEGSLPLASPSGKGAGHRAGDALSFQKQRPWLLQALRLRVTSRCGRAGGLPSGGGVAAGHQTAREVPLLRAAAGLCPEPEPKTISHMQERSFYSLTNSDAYLGSVPQGRTAYKCRSLSNSPPPDISFAGLFSRRVSLACFPSCNN